MDAPQVSATPVESALWEAPMEVHLYLLQFDGEGSAIELARFRQCSHQVEVPLRAPAPVVVNKTVERWESAVYLAVLQGGEVKQVGRLSSFLDGSSRLLEEEEDGLSMPLEEEEEAGLSRPLEEEEEEEEEDDDESQEESQEEESSQEKESSSYSVQESTSIKLRICPRLSRLMLVCFVAGNWTLTRAHQIEWLEDNDKAKVVKVLKITDLGTEYPKDLSRAVAIKQKSFAVQDEPDVSKDALSSMLNVLMFLDYNNMINDFLWAKRSRNKAKELKKEKLKNAAPIKELEEKAEQNLQAELQRKDLTGAAVAVEQKSLAEAYKEKYEKELKDTRELMYAEEAAILDKELKKEKLNAVAIKELQEKADELQKDEETSQQIEKAQEIAKAELAATVAKEKASQIEQIAESNLNVWLEFEGTVLNENLMCAQFNASMRDFRVLKILGKGAAGKVYQCVYRNDPIDEVQYALKKMNISKDFDDTEAINGEEPREVSILSYLEDDFVVSFYQAWAADGSYESYLSSDGEENSDDEKYSSDEEFTMKVGVLEPRYVVIQMEFCQRTLKDDLSYEDHEINIEESWNTFEAITRGVQCMHRTGIIHRDLKPDNIFVGINSTIKIGDMGHACWAKTDEKIRTPNRGTSLYNSPEMDTGHNVTIKADIYSIGVIFMELFHHFSTYLEKVKAVSKIKNDMQPPTDWEGDTKFLMQLMAPCPSDRPSTEEILDYIAQRYRNIDSQ